MPMPDVVYVRVGPKVHQDRLVQQALCTCPWCHLVWEHKENPGQPTFDLQKTREQFGNPNDIWTCPSCNGKSTADILREKRVKFTRVREPERSR